MKANAPLGFPAEIPFVKELGLELHACCEGRAELRLPTGQRHLNSWGVVHGGVLMTLLDVAMAQAARSTAWAMSLVSGQLSFHASGTVVMVEPWLQLKAMTPSFMRLPPNNRARAV